MRKWIVVVAIVVGGGFLFLRRGEETGGGAPPIRRIAVRRGPLTLSVSATGVIGAVRRVEVKSKASGEIIQFPVETGDIVRKGDLLAQLDPTDVRNQYEQARADLEVAEATASLGEKRLERQKELFAQRLLSEEEYEQAILDDKNNRSALVRAHTNLALAEERLRDTTVRAPLDGMILIKNVEEGQIISSGMSLTSTGTTLLEMADLQRVHVEASVDEIDIGHVSPGQPVSIQVDAYPGEVFHGTVLKIEPVATVVQNVTTFPIEIELENPDLRLRPGMNADVEIEVARRRDALVLPHEALLEPGQAAEVAALLGLREAEASEGGQGGVRGRGAMEGRAGMGGPSPSPMGKMGGAGGLPGAGHDGAEALVLRIGKGGPDFQRVRTGLSNWDDVEIVQGLSEGDSVLVVALSQVLMEQAEFRQRMSDMRGIPGMQRRQ